MRAFYFPEPYAPQKGTKSAKIVSPDVSLNLIAWISFVPLVPFCG
jgi:hypothetical protein